MKRCPTCQRTFADETQKFCANDGTPLVADEAPAFDPEATVMSSARPLLEEDEPAQPASDPLPPTQYFVPGSEPVAQSEPQQDIHQSYPPPQQQAAPGAAPSPSWSPTPPQPPQQQPYYPQQGMPGSQPAPPPWQGGQPQGQQPPWMPPGNQPQGQNWGGGYNPQQPGQYAPQAGKSLALSLVTLIAGIISFMNWALSFGMYFRIIQPDRSLAEITVYVMLIFGLLAAVLGIVTLISSRWRNKVLAVIGLVIGIPGVLFFIYLATIGRLP